jgi:transposase
MCRQPRKALVLIPLLLFCPAFSVCQSQAQSVLCREGIGSFGATLGNGITVHVGAAREGGLAKRACAAKLSWKQQELVVEADAAEIDLDAFGVDFGIGAPAAAFQLKRSGTDCCMEYRIYSMQKPFRLFRAITGGGFFSAADVDLDGRIEIWATDARAVNGFDGLSLSEIDFPPMIVFRFEHDRLLDVSAEFQPYFEQEIARIQEEISPRDLQDFRNSDGKLSETPTPANAERLHRLRVAKTMTLEIVWAYLYSGRDLEAWRALAKMWPPSDLERIRGEVMKAQARGLHRQADDTVSGPLLKKKKPVPIFDVDKLSAAGSTPRVIPPRAIQLDLPPPQAGIGPPNHMLLDLVIDAAGKVRSAEPTETAAYPREWSETALAWKFIPAFRDGRPVASRLRINVLPKR